MKEIAYALALSNGVVQSPLNQIIVAFTGLRAKEDQAINIGKF